MALTGRLRLTAKLSQQLQQPRAWDTLVPCAWASSVTSGYAPTENETVSVVRKFGLDILHDPLANKGTAFPSSERERLGLRGLLPIKVLDMQAQVDRFMDDYQFGKTFIDPKHVSDGGVTPEHVRRWRLLQELQDRNETLFYRILLDNFVEMAPIIYTPTVGWACLNYHQIYRRPRGMFISANDRGEMSAMVWNWPSHKVDAIVVTDGSRILGLGDLGLNGLGIPVGKLDCYVAAAGFHPQRVLPVVVDVGTNNEALRNDPLYMGLRQDRITGDEYYEIMDEFVKAVMGRWPTAVLQFEDFNLAHAHPLLSRYRHCHTVFNDDIQGTAGTAVAGIYGALAVQGKPVEAITEQRVVMVGAGSAGMGVVQMLALGMVKHGLSDEEARSRFYILDAEGLITKARGKQLTPVVAPFARSSPDDKERESLLDVVKRVKPTALLGLSGAGPIFTPEVLTAMGEINERPIIFPMSNPTHRMECSAAATQKCTGGRAIFASGSPQNDVVVDGHTVISSQANNLYIFPGLALGAHLSQSGKLTDTMIMAAAEALPTLIPEEDKAAGCVYPRLSNIRAISNRVACDVIKMANTEGLLKNPKAAHALSEGDDKLSEWVNCRMWKPTYTSLIHLPTGVGE